jgi:hypothetical protein
MCGSRLHKPGNVRQTARAAAEVCQMTCAPSYANEGDFWLTTSLVWSTVDPIWQRLQRMEEKHPHVSPRLWT